MHKGIKNIIFDLGGVLLQLNMQATAEAFKRIGFADVDDVYSQKKQVELFNQFDKGQITPDDFRNGIRGFIGSYIPAKMIEDAWNAMLGPLPQNHVDMLLELKNEFNIYEPEEGNRVDPTEIDMILVPLLAYDKKGYRVGYGKGFYDKFFAGCRKDCIKAGFSYFEPVDEITDKADFDVPLDLCITPQTVYVF